MIISEHAVDQYLARVEDISRDEARRKILQIINSGVEVLPKWKKKKRYEHFYVAFDILVIVEKNTVVTIDSLDEISQALYGKKEFELIDG